MTPVTNVEIARMFDEIADLLEIDDASPFRVRAYRTAADTLRGVGHEVGEMVAAGEELTDLPGIGKDLAGKIREALQRGSMQALDDLHTRLPATLELLLNIPGLGPKRVKALYRELGIEELDQLREAAAAGKVHTLRGFGEKTERRILELLDARREKKRRLPRHQAIADAEALIRHLRGAPEVREAVVAGSYRRGKESVGDLDILITASPIGAALDRFARYQGIAELTARGPTRSSAVLRSGLQVDVRAVAPNSFGAALHYFTGSKAHNIEVRRLGQARGLKINEYGVFRGAQRVAGESEESLFAAVGLPFIEPELREDQGEIEAAREGRLPRLVREDDLRGDLHAHTSASDGRADLRTMARAARARGREYLAVTDHSRHFIREGRLDEPLLQRHLDAIDAAAEGIALLKGLEVEIGEEGRLDLPDGVLERLDLVVAAVHTGVNFSRRRQTLRILRAMESPCFTILAHPGGRLLPEREGYEVDLEQVIRQARDRGCFLELNSQPKRLDLTENYCRLAREAGVLVSIASDSHREEDLDNLRFGVTQARRGWLEAGDVLNSRPLAELKGLLAATFRR